VESGFKTAATAAVEAFAKKGVTVADLEKLLPQGEYVGATMERRGGLRLRFWLPNCEEVLAFTGRRTCTAAGSRSVL